ncbi:hypothetical protein IGI04_008032 [Brassica rapa subsp. trilocularis]|uniref:FBD domain-containing protein n=1 Tax=Brassica rapa subsp. trilocularis TaxID=1813537 RepID=A0ABQ7NLF3_BRACM|nr:hypothetical protein IGI04_008032 [Brassica rapa subsp. trilocularis]
MANAACSRFGTRLVKNVVESSPLLITEGKWEFLQLDDVTDEPSVNSSFAALKNWIRNIKQPASDNVEKILLGNKPRSNARPESLVLSFRCTEKYVTQEKVMEFLLSRSEELKQRGMNMSMLSELMELEPVKSSSQLNHMNIMDTNFSMKLSGHVQFSSNSNVALHDLLLIASEFDNEVLTQVVVLAPSKRLKPSQNKQNIIEKLRRETSTRGTFCLC